MDGARNEEGSGAGIHLTCPEGLNFEYALSFGFKATNNEAEYVALIAGVELALLNDGRHVDASMTPKSW